MCIEREMYTHTMYNIDVNSRMASSVSGARKYGLSSRGEILESKALSLSSSDVEISHTRD